MHHNHSDLRIVSPDINPETLVTTFPNDWISHTIKYCDDNDFLVINYEEDLIEESTR